MKKRLFSIILIACMMFSNITFAKAHPMNEAFERLDVASILPGWDIQYATDARNTIILTCPDMNLMFRDICAQLYDIREKTVTANSEDAMSFVIRYLFSSGVNEQYLETARVGLGMFLTQQGGLSNTLFGMTEFKGGGENITGRRMDIYFNVNGGYNIDELDKAYFEKMKQLVTEARAYSHYQTEQLDYFVKWLYENTAYELGAPAGAAQLVINGTGVCDHYSNAVQDFCLLTGIPSLFVENYVQVHGWNYLCLDNMWYEYDATNNGHLGVNHGTLLRPTYGRNAGDEFSVNNLNILKEVILKRGVRVVLDGKSLGFDQKPVIENGRTLVPLRVIFEALGAKVEWINETQSVVAEKDGTEVEMSIGSNTYYVNGEEKVLDVPPQIVNGRTLVPARAVAESFNCNVEWFDAMNTVVINSR